MPLNPGQVLNNRYRIAKLLGKGGFGAVYKAWDLHLKSSCAVKENLDTTSEAQQQFEREAMMLAKLHHQNLPRVIDHFSLPGQGQYLVMDFIEGDNLEQILEKNAAPLSEDVVLSWLQQICSALTYLHAQKEPIIHRDIKPANIKVTPQGQVFLVDFGIAKIFDPHLRTTVGARAVTPGYSPPEQYGHGKTDPRSDIYALGATMYKALTGHEPTESVQRTIGTPMPAPRQLNQAIHRRTEAIILKAMDTTPTNRFQSAAELVATLTSPNEPIRSQEKKTSPANWLVILGTAGALVLCVAAVFGGVTLYRILAGTQTPRSTEVATRLSPTPDRPDTQAIPQPGESAVPVLLSSATLNSGQVSTLAAQTVAAQLTQLAGTPTPLPYATLVPSLTRLPPTLVPSATRTGGGLIAFHSDRSGNRDIWVMDPDGANPRQITYDGAIDSVPAWSPDGDELAFQSMRDGDFEIFIYTFSTGVTRQLTFNTCADYGPAWAPDGSSLIYYSNCNSSEDQRELFTIDANGANNQQLTDFEDHNNRYPTYSPDGSWITFTGYDNDGYYVFIMRADGTDIRRITRGCISSYSPDGTLILYTSYCTGGEVNVINVDGTDIRQLTNTPSFENGTPAWSPDGTYIIFQSDRDGDAEIFIINSDGTGETQLTFNSTHDGAAVWQP